MKDLCKIESAVISFIKRPAAAIAALAAIFVIGVSSAPATDTCFRYSLPPEISQKPFYFAGELVPIQRPDVKARILSQINFLLLDARSVVTEWLSEKSKYNRVFEKIFQEEGVPRTFILFSPVISGSSLRSTFRGNGAGWWALEKPCSGDEGMDMADDSWHDDRMDLELSTKCFSVRIKKIQKEIGDTGWLMTAAAYVTSPKIVQQYEQKWNTEVFWNLPLPDAAEDLVVRWVAFSIIYLHRDYFGLKFTELAPFEYDKVAVATAKDLPIGVIAGMVQASPREILEMNPKIKPGSAVFPATRKNAEALQSILIPKGKKQQFLERLKAEGYLLH